MTFFRYHLLSAALLFLASSGSAHAAPTSATIPDDIQKASLRAVENLRHQKIDAIEQEATDSSRHQDLPTILSKMAAAFPAGEPRLIRSVGYDVTVGGSGDMSYFASYEYQFPERWVLVRLEWQRLEGKLRLNGINIELLKASVEDTNAFTFGGKGLVNYMIVCLAVLAPLFTLYTLFLCLKTKGLKWKWVWAIIILIGVGSLSLDWTTGSSRVTILSLKLLSVSWVRSGVGPWVISVGLPLGALLFIWRLARLKKGRSQMVPSPARA